MTLSEEDFKHIRDGEWLHVAFPSGSQVSGAAIRSGRYLGINVSERSFAVVIAHDGTVIASRVLAPEARPKRALEVGEVISEEEWDDYAWPEGWTVLFSRLNQPLVTHSGDVPYYLDVYATAWPVTVMQLPPTPTRTLTTVEEVESMPLESVIADSAGAVLRRKYVRGWTGAETFWSSNAVAFPVTVLREGSPPQSPEAVKLSADSKGDLPRE